MDLLDVKILPQDEIMLSCKDISNQTKPARMTFYIRELPQEHLCLS